MKRLFDRLAVKKSGSKGTEESYSRTFYEFHEYSKINPDEFVEQWRKASKESLEDALEDFDVKLDAFLKWLMTERKLGKGKLTKSTAVKYHAALKSLINYNSRIKLAIGTPSSGIPKTYKPLTLEEVRRLDAVGNLQQKWIIRSLKDSGMSREDFAELTYGHVAKQFEAGEQFIHLDVTRLKEQVVYETFLGPNAVKALKEYVQWRKSRGETITAESPLTATYKRPFKAIRPDVITIFLNRLGHQIGLGASPHRLRKTFETYLALIVRHPLILKYWMGHKIKMDIDSRYIIPPPQEQMKLYQEAYKNIDIEQESMEERLKALEKLKETLTPEQLHLARTARILRHRKIKTKKTETNGGCTDGQHCDEQFEQVNESDLLTYLREGWAIVHTLQNGEIIVRR